MTPDEQQLIDDGLAVRQFLESDAGKRVKEQTGKFIYNQWRVAKTTVERELMWAKSEAFNTLFDMLDSTAEKGDNAQMQRTRRLKVEAQKS